MNAGIGYIIIFFIHPSSIIFPILNLIVKISNKWMKYIFVIATFVFFIFSYQISSILLRIVPSGSTFSDVVNKLNSYSGWTSRLNKLWDNNSKSNFMVDGDCNDFCFVFF